MHKVASLKVDRIRSRLEIVGTSGPTFNEGRVIAIIVAIIIAIIIAMLIAIIIAIIMAIIIMIVLLLLNMEPRTQRQHS